MLLASALLGLLALPALPAPQSPPAPAVQPSGERVERVVAVMGTTLALSVTANTRTEALRASEAAVRAVEACEARLSTWGETSELARLNAAAVGARMQLSPTLAAELAAARAVWQETGGAFDPSVGALVRAWDLRGTGRVPDADALTQALAATGFAGLALEEDAAMRLFPELVLEEGGFGKGAGLDAALAALSLAGARAARLDLGGQIALLGGEPARIELAHPFHRDVPLLELALTGGSIATSGNSERAITVDGMRYGHLLDPRTGRPAPDFGSVTVRAESALRADALSTGLFVLGPERALAFAAEHADVDVIVIRAGPNGTSARASAGWRGRVTSSTHELELSFSQK